MKMAKRHVETKRGSGMGNVRTVRRNERTIPRSHTAMLFSASRWTSRLLSRTFKSKEDQTVDEKQDEGEREIERTQSHVLAGSTAQHASRMARRIGVPVYVMLPLDTVSADGTITAKHAKALGVGLKALRAAGVEGVMVDIWWGVVERDGPKKYDWSAYRRILQMVKDAGLTMQAVMSFHACGCNVGDQRGVLQPDKQHIPLPTWVLEAMDEDPDLMFTDRWGYRNPECISLFAHDSPTVAGRTPIECYRDFMASFKNALGEELGTTVTDISIGCGPCGELRYPSYPEGSGRWRFPGIGEFMCYDRRALMSLANAAKEVGRDEWGSGGPHDAGSYNDWPDNTGFFATSQGSWESDYGIFFLSWYSRELISHGERMVENAFNVFAGSSVHLSIKLAGVHWWYNCRSHAAELAAGYYNTYGRDGYDAIVEMCAKWGIGLNFTCMEMQDHEHPFEAQCGPEGLLRQVRAAAARHSVPLAGENALTRFDSDAYNRILQNAHGGLDNYGIPLPPLASFTFLRLLPELFEGWNLTEFMKFVKRMADGDQVTERADSSLDVPNVRMTIDESWLEGDAEESKESLNASGQRFVLFKFTRG